MESLKNYVTCIIAFALHNFVTLCVNFALSLPLCYSINFRRLFANMAASVSHVISKKVENHIFGHN